MLSSGWQRGGPEVLAFEAEFAAFIGCQHAIALPSGAIALELCLRSFRLPHGSRVLLSTFSPVAAVLAVLRASLVPVLLDVAADTGMPGVDQVEDVARAGRLRAAALVVSHWGGDPSAAAELGDAAGLLPSRIVDDACEAMGARHGSRPVGSTGTACFRCSGGTPGLIGDGGVLTTDDAHRAADLRRVRDRGGSRAARRHVSQGHAGPHVLAEGGLPLGLTEQSAANGRARLRQLPERQRRRHELAALYDARLADVARTSLPHRPLPADGDHSWQAYRVRLDGDAARRDRVVAALRQAGVDAVADVLPVHHDAQCRAVCELPAAGLPNADWLADRLVSLPIRAPHAHRVVDRAGRVLEQVS